MLVSKFKNKCLIQTCRVNVDIKNLFSICIFQNIYFVTYISTQASGSFMNYYHKKFCCVFLRNYLFFKNYKYIFDHIVYFTPLDPKFNFTSWIQDLIISLVLLNKKNKIFGWRKVVKFLSEIGNCVYHEFRSKFF